MYTFLSFMVHSNETNEVYQVYKGGHFYLLHKNITSYFTTINHNRSVLKQNISYKKAFDFYTGPHPTEDCTTYLQAYIQSDYNVVNIVKLKTKTKEEKPNSICSYIKLLCQRLYLCVLVTAQSSITKYRAECSETLTAKTGLRPLYIVYKSKNYVQKSLRKSHKNLFISILEFLIYYISLSYTWH